jgi:serpin B
MRHSALRIVLAALALTACSSKDGAPDGAPEDQIEVVRSAQQRNTTPTLSSAETEMLAKGQADFAVDIFRAVATSPERAGENVFLSPHSISIALGMTYAGARGETAAEMKKALHLDLPDDRVHAGFDYLDLALASRGQGAKGKDDKPFRLKVTNSIWGQKGTSFEAPFLDTIAVNYGAGLNIVDFRTETEKARVTINRWVEKQTEDRIKDLIPTGSVDPSTRMVLVNAVYFNAAWAARFMQGATQPAPFERVDGSTTQVAMMNRQESYPYAKGDGYEAVELPYEGGELSMLAIVPNKGTYATFESSLTGGKVLDILAGLAPKQVSLSFPKLKLEAAFGLHDALVSLGMKSAFESSADFSGLSKAEGLAIADVLHKTFLELDENGTEAAAVTAAVLEGTSAVVEPPVKLMVDRPFITAIVDRQTKTLVFLGRILEPKI